MQCVSRQEKEETGPKGVKVVAVGDFKSGKSHLLLTMTEQKPIEECNDVIYSFKEITLENAQGRELVINSFNSCSREDYDRLRPLIYPNTDIVLACFSVVNSDSFLNVQEIWVPEVRYHLPKVPIILVGCWKELREDPKKLKKLQEKCQVPVSTAEGLEMREEIGAVAYLECSPKTADGIPELLETIMEEYIKYEEEKKKHSRKNSCVVL